MPSPISDPRQAAAAAGLHQPALPRGPREYLDDGQRYEQGGDCERALASYAAVFESGATLEEQAEARLRSARVHRTCARWDEAIHESRDAVRLAERAGSDDLAAEAMNVEV